jgi:hypothetical protein
VPEAELVVVPALAAPVREVAATEASVARALAEQEWVAPEEPVAREQAALAAPAAAPAAAPGALEARAHLPGLRADRVVRAPVDCSTTEVAGRAACTATVGIVKYPRYRTLRCALTPRGAVSHVDPQALG